MQSAVHKDSPKRKIRGKGFYGTLLFLLLLAALVKWRMWALELALQKYVSIKTNHEYALDIGSTYIDFWNTELDFTEVSLTRNPRMGAKNGLHALHIPHIHLQLSSFKVFLYADSLEIETLKLEQPQVEIKRAQLKSNTHKSFASQLVKLYPASQEFLKRFRVHELIVNKGELGFQYTREETIRIGLIDFYLFEWNVPDLSERSKLLLTLGKQQLEYGQVALDFSQLHYSFEEKYVKLSEFTFRLKDPTGNSSVQVKGKEVLIDSIDYGELMEYERYRVKAVQIENPELDIEFALQARKSEITDERKRITDVLKKSIGEFFLDTLRLQRTRLRLKISRDSDTLQLSFPSADIFLHELAVYENRPHFELDQLVLNIPKTELKLFNQLGISCNQFLLNQYGDVAFGGVHIYQAKRGKSADTLAECERIYFKDLEVASLAFEKKIQAQSLTIEDARIQLSQELVKSLKKNSARGKKDWNSIAIEELACRHVDVSYADSTGNIYVVDASASATKSSQRDAFPYSLTYFQATALLHELADASKLTELKNLEYENQRVKVSYLNHKDSSMQVRVRDLTIHPVQLSKQFNWRTGLDTVSVKEAWIEADINAAQSSDSSSRDFRLSYLDVQSLQMKIRYGKVSFKSGGKDIVLHGMENKEGKFSFQKVKGILSDLGYEDGTMKAKADELRLNSQTISVIKRPVLLQPALKVRCEQVSFGAIQASPGSIQVPWIRANDPGIKVPGKAVLFSDSVRLDRFSLSHGKVSVERVALFHNVLHLLKRGQGAGMPDWQRILDATQLGPVQQLYFDSLAVQDANTRTWFWINGLQAKRDNQHLQIGLHRLRTTLNSMRIQVDTFLLSKHKGTVQGFSVKPESAFDLRKDSLDYLALHASDITLANDRLYSSAGIKFLKIGNAEIDVRKNKILEPVHASVKPYLLDSMFRPLARLGVEEIDMQRSQVSYQEYSDTSSLPLHAQVTDLQWILHSPASDGLMELKGGGKLFNKEVFNLRYQSLDSVNFGLNIYASQFQLQSLNYLHIPRLPLAIKSGWVKDLQYQLNGNGDSARAQVQLKFQKLRVRNADSTATRRRALPALVNVYLRVRRKNLQGEVVVSRDKRRSVVSYWLAGMKKGILSGDTLAKLIMRKVSKRQKVKSSS
ncbi:MAG: hypothetical protein MUF42_02660 [Cytophagaceae bacterium]|jgi:hypothetical protein|nr:hypothetical protein [Cytophagaceae bacterium]